MSRLTILIALALLTIACGESDTPIQPQDAGGDSGVGGVDIGSTSNGTVDMGTSDTGSPAVDMGADMGGPQMNWPEYSGTPCNVDGEPGVCLPTASCGGVATPGHCPGPADMQCCVSGCDANGEAGMCTSSAICGDAVVTDECAGPTGTACCAPSEQGTLWGTAWNTYYYLPLETDYPGEQDTTLFDVNCDPVAMVSASYSDAVCIEGSGKLEDGTVVNYAATCDCGRPCPTGSIICWKELDGATHPWGEGAMSNPLVPLRSIAVDRDEIPLGSPVYLPKFDGVQVPAIGGVEAFTHDGCFRADDVGGAIQGEHIDIFTGPEDMWRHFEGVFPTRTNHDIYLGVAKCQ